MTADANTEHTHDSSTAGGSSSNRYILFAAIAVAVVAAVYLIKANMEPPKTTGTEGGVEAPEANVPGGTEPDSALMQDITHQIGHVRAILAKDSSNFDAWVALGNLFFDAGMADEAIAHYRRALDLHPSDVNVLTDMATMQREAGHPAEAVATLTRVVAIDSTHPQSWFNLGVIYAFDLKNSKDAISAWRKFLALSPPSEHTEAIRKEVERLEKESGS